MSEQVTVTQSNSAQAYTSQSLPVSGVTTVDGVAGAVALTGKYLRFDAAQSLTSGQQAQGRANVNVTATRLDQFAAPTAPVALGAQKITGLANGTASTDGVAFGQLAAYSLLPNAVEPSMWVTKHGSDTNDGL